MVYSTQIVRVVDGNIEGYLTVSQFGKKHDLSGASLRNWIRSGDVDAIKIGRSYYIPENAVAPIFKSRGKTGRRYYSCSAPNDRDGVKLSKTSCRILECLSKRSGMTVRNIWRSISDRSLTAIYFNIDLLVEKGLITDKRSSAK